MSGRLFQQMVAKFSGDREFPAGWSAVGGQTATFYWFRRPIGVLVVAWLIFAATSCRHRELPPSLAGEANGWYSPVLDRSEVEETVASLVRTAQQPVKMLLLTGGGANGAFGAGVLNGWPALLGRPRFDVVAGVSTGALLATFAFLGNEADDAVLRETYTRVTRDDIMENRNLWNLPFSSSIAHSTPLAALIDRWVSNDVIDRVAVAGESGRILLMGTTNLDRGGAVLWDMTALARSDDPGRYAFYRRILLTSSSFPILMPPIPLPDELHADGAIRGRMFAEHLMRAIAVGLNNRRVYDPTMVSVVLIVNTKLGVEVRPVQESILDISRRSMSLMLDENVAAMVRETQAAARQCGFRLDVARIPDEFLINDDPSDFDPEEMVRLYECGRRFGSPENPEKLWEVIPPLISQPLPADK